MIDIEQWMAELGEKLRNKFGNRLIYLGLQGSYNRGEANENSDIDAVVLLDTLKAEDMDSYRSIIETMPNAEKSCGFISGLEEFRCWPRYELFQFACDTRDIIGNLQDFLPEIQKEDIRLAVRISAANLYHLICHSYIHSNSEVGYEALKMCYKPVFYLLQNLHYLKNGGSGSDQKRTSATLA